jgi:hypothetical protein
LWYSHKVPGSINSWKSVCSVILLPLLAYYIEVLEQLRISRKFLAKEILNHCCFCFEPHSLCIFTFTLNQRLCVSWNLQQQVISTFEPNIVSWCWIMWGLQVGRWVLTLKTLKRAWLRRSSSIRINLTSLWSCYLFSNFLTFVILENCKGFILVWRKTFWSEFFWEYLNVVIFWNLQGFILIWRITFWSDWFSI